MRHSWCMICRAAKLTEEGDQEGSTRLKGNMAVGVLLVALAIVISALPAFFLVFNAIFSDSGGAGEHVLVMALVFVVYAALGAVFGFAWPGLSFWWGAWLGMTAAVLVIWYSTNEGGPSAGRLLLHAAYLVVTISAACLGGYAGARLRRARTSV